MKLYVAGKWAEMSTVGARISELQELGYTVTHDWTQVEQSDRSNAALGRYGQWDIEGVKGADCLVVLLTDVNYPYRGTFCEIGCALGLGKKVLVMTPGGYDSHGDWPCFFYHPEIVHVSSWDEVLSQLSKWKSDTEVTGPTGVQGAVGPKGATGFTGPIGIVVGQEIGVQTAQRGASIVNRF